jgi:DnaJ-class molecular chaperone
MAMKFSPDRPYSDAEKAARKLLEITNAVEAVQDGRIHVKFAQADADLFA